MTTSIASKLPLAGGTLTGNLNLGDNVRARFGLDSDLQIYHDGTHSYINCSTGQVICKNEVLPIQIENQSGSEDLATFAVNGAVTLYHNNAAKIATTSTGIDVTGNVDLPDNGKLLLGASDDLEIYHDGTNSYIADRGTGNLRLEGTNIALNNQASNKTYLLATDGGSVQLRHNDLTKIETTTTGIDVTGNIGVTGTVDGIDIAARDAVLTSTTTTAGAALPKAGGTMTGPITMSQSGALHNQFTSTGSFSKISIISADGEQAYINYSGATNEMSAGYDRTTSQFRISNADTLSSGIRMSINSSTGNTSIAGATQDRRLTINNSQANGLQFNFDDSNAYRIRLTPYWSSNANTRLDFDVARTSGATPSTIMSVGYNSNVGIGTTTPGRALEVSTDGTAQFRLSRVDSTINGNNTLGTIEFWGTDDTSGTIGATIVAHAASTWGGGAYPTDLRFSTMDGSTLSEQMRITRLGDISIGSDHGGFSGWKVLNIRQSSTGGMVNFEEDDGTRAFTFANQGVGMRYQAHITGGYHRFETHAMGGGTAMMITDAGNVGIGTTAPSNLLHIHATGNGSSALIVEDDARRLELGRDMIQAKSSNGSTVQNLYIQPAGVTSFASNSGSVGIGTASPTSKLEVTVTQSDTMTDDTAAFAIKGNGGDGILMGQRATTPYAAWIAAGYLPNIGTSHNYPLTLQPHGGNVGIGETSPDGKLHIKGSTATGDASHILFENTQGSKVFAIGGGSTGITNGNLYFRNVTDNTRPMVITDAGNVGIGIDTPSDGDMSLGIPKVHVYGGTGTGSYALLQRFQNGSDADDTGASIVLNHSNDRGIIIEGGRSIGNRSHGAIKSIDNVGRVTDAFKILGGNGAGVNSISLFTGESTTTTERMTIDSSGNVGIGTDNPSSKLTVKNSTATDGNNIADFVGSDTNQRLIVANFLCGSDEDRVGLYWENQGTINMRMWMADTGNLYLNSSNPSNDTDGSRVLLAESNGNTIVGTQIHFNNTTASSFIGAASTVNLRYAADGYHRFDTYNGGWGERVRIDDVGLDIISGHTLEMAGTTVIDASKNATVTTLKETDGGYGFIEMGPSGAACSYFNWGLEIANSGNGYTGVRFAGKKKYFEIEADIFSGNANHQGFFWGNLDGTAVFGGSSSGYKTTHQGSTTFHIRDTAGNANQVTINPGFSPSDSVWHHQKIAATPDGYVRVWLDGVLVIEKTGYIPSAAGYIGFINYTGTARYANIVCRGIESEVSPAFRAVGTNTSTNSGVVPFGTQVFDRGNNYSSNRFTAPKAGVYHISWSVKGQSAGQSVYCRAQKNGTAYGPALEFHNTILSQHTHMAFIDQLDDGDYIEIGSASNVKTDAADSFQIHKSKNIA